MDPILSRNAKETIRRAKNLMVIHYDTDNVMGVLVRSNDARAECGFNHGSTWKQNLERPG